MRIIIVVIAILSAISCASAERGEHYIEVTEVKRKIINMLYLNPGYKGKEIDREVIEITIISKKNFIEESQRRGMTLYAHTGKCMNFEHIPTLASSKIYSNGKSADYYSMGDAPKPDRQGVFQYKIYLRYDTLKNFIAQDKLSLCTEFVGDTYLFGYKSNRIKLDFSHIEI